MPPLRERRDEIPLLVDHFLQKFNEQYGRTVDVPSETMRAFIEYHWPGNVRELENTVKRIVVLGSDAPCPCRDPRQSQRRAAAPSGPARPRSRPGPAPTRRSSLKDIARQAARDAERVAIKEVLDRVHWNRAKAARLLQISYKALLYKIVQCGLVVVQDSEKEDKPKEVMAS